jgi:hypothetical protein
MKKQAIILASLTIAMLLSETGLSSDLLLFFLVGAIPGTGYSLPSTIMLTFYAAAAISVVAHLLHTQGFTNLLIKQFHKSRHLIKGALVKHPISEA